MEDTLQKMASVFQRSKGKPRSHRIVARIGIVTTMMTIKPPRHNLHVHDDDDAVPFFLSRPPPRRHNDDICDGGIKSRIVCPTDNVQRQERHDQVLPKLVRPLHGAFDLFSILLSLLMPSHTVFFTAIEQQMKPAWDELADTVDSSVFVADVNCGDQEELCEQVGVSGYPTIKVYKDGEVSDYQGGRSVEDLLEYVDSELAVKCNVNNMRESNCSEKAIKYVDKWTAKMKEEKGASVMEKEMARLQGMAGKSMTPELKAWLRERLNILTQLTADASASAEEL